MTNLTQIIKKFEECHKFRLMIGVEFEFYIIDSDLKKLECNKLSHIINILNNSFNCNNFTKEQGGSQVEFTLNATYNINELCYKLSFYKSRIKYILKLYNLYPVIEGQPFKDDCGSSLQLNFSLHDFNNNFIDDKNIINNFCCKLLDATAEISKFLYVKNSLNSKLRFDKELNIVLYKKGKFCAPINLSYGYDNRTCLVRIAKSNINHKFKRIEYRGASCDVNIRLLILNLLKEIINLNKKITNKYNIIYGNAFDEIYKLKPIFAE